MKKNTLTILLIVMLAALLLSSCGTKTPSNSGDEAPVIEDPVLETQAIELQTEPQAAQLDPDRYYCTLVIDTWTAHDGKLDVSTFAQATLPEGMEATAQIELWKDSTVLESQPITLGAGEGEGICEADVSVTFDLPEIAVDEELQLWLTIDVDGAQALFSCAGGWYLEDGQLMLITG